MKRFLSKTILLIILVCYVLTSYYLLRLWLLHPLNPNAVYVWGDSQTYQGLQLKIISDAVHHPVYSAAEHGNGVYDFLVFAENVPANTTCIIGFSEACLYRKITSDNNRSGADIRALYSLYNSGYPLSEILNIFTLNRGTPKCDFKSSHGMYVYTDTICLPESVEDWCKMFATEEPYHIYKQKAYLSGVERLKNKGCTLIFVSFPIYEWVEECASISINRAKTNEFKEQLLENYNIQEIEWDLQSDSLLMHDLSHLNEIGARIATTKLSNSTYLVNGQNYLISFHLPSQIN